MNVWLAHFRDRISGSLWFMPVLMSLGAIGLAVIATLVDDAVARAARNHGYLYAGDVDSARTVLSTIAASIINVAGVSFSVTMVALSLASSQFGPHLLANFMRDRGNQIVLGGFIATFLFCLLALGMTTGDAKSTASVTASIALLLAGTSLALLIYFIHHIATSMQADHVIEQVARDLQRSLEPVFPEAPDPPEAPELQDPPAPVLPPGRFPGLVPAPRTGYFQAVDEAALIRLATHHDLCLRMLHRPGHYVIEGAPLVAVSIDVSAHDELAHRIQRSFILGGQRTAEQDPEYGVHQLVQVAVRALSPGINDPFTAIACVDRLTGILCRIGPRPARSTLRLDEAGEPRLAIDPVDFEGVIDAAFHQIRQFSTEIPSVSIRVLEGLTSVATTLHDPARRAAVARHGRMLMAAQQGRHLREDQTALEERFAALGQALQAAGAAPAG